MHTKLLSTDRPIALYYAFLTEVTSFSEIGKSKCSVSIPSGWNLIHTTIGTIEFEETPNKSSAGVLYTNTITATVPGHNSDTPEKSDSINGRKVLIRADYRNGLKKIIGNTEFAPELFISINSGVNTARKLTSEFSTIYISRCLIE